MQNNEKRRRIRNIIIGSVVLIFVIYFATSIFEQTKEFKKRDLEIHRLQNEISKINKENKLLNDPNYVKNEFRKKYNYVEGNEKIINFPDKDK